jgi:coenzyme F420-reducing hydrogenase alpha subunit
MGEDAGSAPTGEKFSKMNKDQRYRMVNRAMRINGNQPEALIETLHAVQDSFGFLDRDYGEGVGVVEAPRGTLFHHYRVDSNGLITWVNLIVATGNNNLAINQGVLQVARRFLEDGKLTDAAANRIQAVARAFDPCLSCSTHALKQYAKNQHADMVIIGTHGARGLEEILLGGVAERVLKRIHCPCLVMNPYR